MSATLGSALATALYASWLSISQVGTLPSTPEDFRMGLAIGFAASSFTIPGALLLAAAEFALFDRVRSERILDGAVIVLGGFAGAAILGCLSLSEAPLDFALLGGFYGLTTATLYVFFQRQLGSRQR